MNIITQKFEENKLIGTIKISNEVISAIAGTAALEVEGVVCTPIETKGILVEWINKKNLSKGVSVDVRENLVYIDISLIVSFGCKIDEVSKNVQEYVKNAVETMVGLEVKEINISIEGIIDNQLINLN